MILRYAAIALALSASFHATAQQLNCDMREYKALDGLKAEMRNGSLELSWRGAPGQELRAAFVIRQGQPVVAELAARKTGGNWIVLGRDLTPEFEVTSGKRRLSEQQMAPLRALGIKLTPEVVEREKWNRVLGCAADDSGRAQHQSRPASPAGGNAPRLGQLEATGCKVKTDGARARNYISRPHHGNFFGRFALYGVSRDEPAAPGGDREDRGAVRRV